MKSAVLALSFDAQARLLRTIAIRRTAEVTLLTIPGLLAWFYSSHATDTTAITNWAIGMALFAAYLTWMRRRYLAAEKVQTASAILAKWLPLTCVNAVVFGFAWVVPIGLTWSNPVQDFSLLLYMTFCAISAGACSYLAAVMPVFVSFMLGIWVVAIAASLPAFPMFTSVGWFVFLCAVVFCFVILRHGVSANRFFRQQIYLEEQSQKLAEDYKKAQNRAEIALMEKSLFLTTASHDLRQPMHAMTMLVESIWLRNKDSSLEPLISDFKSSMRFMGTMFHALFNGLADTHGLKLRVRASNRPSMAFVDPVLLRQALINLVQNALRYTVYGGVLIGIRHEGAYCRIEVWDTGMGISLDEQDKIFAPYFRSDQALQIDHTGHGIGLSVVARSAALMQATYGFKSQQNKGSCFWLSLKRAEPQRVVEVIRDAISILALYGRCLIVDDDVTALKAWQSMLESWGIESRFASSFAQSIEYLEEGFLPDAIFCDQQLNDGEDGFEVLKALLGRCPNANGAMVSGETNSPVLKVAELEGYVVIQKPLDLVLLRTLLETWLMKGSSASDHSP
jgi:signal transduction histidine kinase/CheY-like chemotaxis protein